jgi:hypothetical protein
LNKESLEFSLIEQEENIEQYLIAKSSCLIENQVKNLISFINLIVFI